MDGIIIINKPRENTSHDIVQKARKILNEKVGHTRNIRPCLLYTSDAADEY